MMNILGVVLAVCVGASGVVGYDTRDIDKLFDELDEIKNGGKTETWKMVLTIEKYRYDADFNIQRMNCWEGAFVGDGVLKTDVSQKVSIQGTLYQNGEIVFVFTHHNGDATLKMIGTGNIDDKNGKMIRGSTTTMSAHEPWTLTFSGLNNQLGTKWIWSSKEEAKGEKSESVMFSTAGGLLNGKGKDNLGDEWTSKGTIKNGKLHLVMTFQDGETMLFDGTLDAEKQIIDGYASPKGSLTGSFAIEMN